MACFGFIQQHHFTLKDPRYHAALSADMSKVLKLNGESFATPNDGQYYIPDDITSFPALARALREVVKAEFPSHWDEEQASTEP
jgi:hypothetical protein